MRKMSSKKIAVSEEVYNLLVQLKLPHESLEDVIKRLCQEKTAFAVAQWVNERPLWSDMSKEEYTSVQKSINENRRRFHIQEVNLD